MKHYPTHEEISNTIQYLVTNNLNCPHTHNRENLDDIISDLEQYRDSIPTIEEYLEVNLL